MIPVFVLPSVCQINKVTPYNGSRKTIGEIIQENHNKVSNDFHLHFGLIISAKC